MRFTKTRTGDAAFELNLAPFLDIIVSIVPMLLLSIAFVQIKMIESPTPQMVTQDQIKTPPKKETTITLHVSNKHGFIFDIDDESGKKDKMTVPVVDGKFNLASLTASALALKGRYPKLSTLQMAPDGDVAFDDLVQIMDSVREKPSARKSAEDYSLTDVAAGVKPESRQLFPDIVFTSVGG